MIIYTDASSKDGGHPWKGDIHRGSVDKERASPPHQRTRTIGSEKSLKTVLKGRNPKLIHIYIDMTALYYHVCKGGTKSMTLTKTAKRIWEFLKQQGTMITAEKRSESIFIMAWFGITEPSTPCLFKKLTSI